ncbi:hypothetical protein [Hufsiella ginkgonis]|uniref:hypothetical protein n=1 Tax=Hufsiella ginkgonis TaxID=2695274 RepID=UPI001F384717|nr:hypothetical protein [Hufsiella ginkgonis]
MSSGVSFFLCLGDETDSYLKRNEYQAELAIRNFTHFGMDGGLGIHQEHEVPDSPMFGELPVLKGLHGKAVRQLGTSGNGTHFVNLASWNWWKATISAFLPKSTRRCCRTPAAAASGSLSQSITHRSR